MKVGRNQPCPCGSGIKYKRCCYRKIGEKAQGEMNQELASVLAANPGLSHAELQSAMQRRAAAYNNSPHPDFCGLSPNQIQNWMNSAFKNLQWVTFSTPRNLSLCPVMRYLALILDEAIENGGSIKATAKGNLNVTLVEKASFLWSSFSTTKYDWEIEFSAFMGRTEEDFDALHYSKILAEMIGIIELRKGRLHVAQANQDLYKRQGIGAFYLPMLETAVNKFNWSYLDGFEPDVDIRRFWLFMVWRFQAHASVEKLCQEVFTAFPPLLNEFAQQDTLPPSEFGSMVISNRFVYRFLHFWGFIPIKSKLKLFTDNPSNQLSKTPLLAQTFKFSV